MTRVTDIAKRPIPLQLGDLKREEAYLEQYGWTVTGEAQRECMKRLKTVRHRIALIEGNTDAR